MTCFASARGNRRLVVSLALFLVLLIVHHPARAIDYVHLISETNLGVSPIDMATSGDTVAVACGASGLRLLRVDSEGTLITLADPTDINALAVSVHNGYVITGQPSGVVVYEPGPGTMLTEVDQWTAPDMITRLAVSGDGLLAAAREGYITLFAVNDAGQLDELSTIALAETTDLPEDMELSGDVLAIIDYPQLTFFDIANPAQPSWGSNWSYSWYIDYEIITLEPHSLSSGGGKVWVAGAGSQHWGGYLLGLDVSDPHHVIYTMGQIPPNLPSNAPDMMSDNGTLYAAVTSDGFHVYDISTGDLEYLSRCATTPDDNPNRWAGGHGNWAWGLTTAGDFRIFDTHQLFGPPLPTVQNVIARTYAEGPVELRWDPLDDYPGELVYDIYYNGQFAFTADTNPCEIPVPAGPLMISYQVLPRDGIYPLQLSAAAPVRRMRLTDAPAYNVTAGYGDNSAMADFDGDGDDDVLIVADSHSGFAIVTNNDGRFNETTLYTMDVDRDCAAGDIDGNGLADIVSCSGSDDRISVFYQDEPGVFSEAVDFTDVEFPRKVAVADIFNDGLADIAFLHVVGGEDVVGVYSHHADGWTRMTVYLDLSEDGRYSFIKIVDCNEDGLLDLLYGGEQLRYSPQNNNDGFWGSHVLYSTNAWGGWQDADAADFDHDGDIDFAVLTKYDAGVLMKNGGLYYQQVAETWCDFVSFANVSGDSTLELLLSSPLETYRYDADNETWTGGRDGLVVGKVIEHNDYSGDGHDELLVLETSGLLSTTRSLEPENTPEIIAEIDALGETDFTWGHADTLRFQYRVFPNRDDAQELDVWLTQQYGRYGTQPDSFVQHDPVAVTVVPNQIWGEAIELPIHADSPEGQQKLFLNVGHYPDEVLSWDELKFSVLGPVAVSEEGGGNVQEVAAEPNQPSSPLLLDTWPNPFNARLTARITLAQPSRATVTVYNVLGQQVAVLAQGRPLAAGPHTFSLEGNTLAAGLYFIHAATDSGVHQIRKVTLLK